MQTKGRGHIIFRDWSNSKEKENLDDSGEPMDEATRTVAEFLTIYGRHAFDIEQVEANDLRLQCGLWSRHFLAGGPAPGGRHSPQSDWDGVKQFFDRHRRRERVYVYNSMRDLRSMIWDFIQGICRTVSEDRQADGQVRERLSQLKQAVERDSSEELKKEALEVVHAIGEAIELRQKRQRSQMLQLGQKLRQMRCELIGARQKMSSDPLTRLYNRSAFDEHLKRTAGLCLLLGQPACLIMLDADHFQAVNDSFGPQAGDAALRQLADRCVQSFPRKNDFVARCGGEEFAVIVSEAGIEVGAKLAKALLEMIRKTPIEHEGNQIPLTVSIGVAELKPGDSAQDWLRKTDQALCRAKSQGRDRVIISSRATG